MSITRGVSFQNSILFSIFSFLVIFILSLSTCDETTLLTSSEEWVDVCDSALVFDPSQAVALEPTRDY